MSWTPPADAGICCVQYRVVSSNGTSLNTTQRSFTLSGITTQEERDKCLYFQFRFVWIRLGQWDRWLLIDLILVC